MQMYYRNYGFESLRMLGALTITLEMRTAF